MPVLLFIQLVLLNLRFNSCCDGTIIRSLRQQLPLQDRTSLTSKAFFNYLREIARLCQVQNAAITLAVSQIEQTAV